MEKENQRIAITKRLLKESLLGLLEEKALEKISVTELCREAGINRATFYRHYEIPRDVLIDLEKDLYYHLRRSVSLPQSPADVRRSIEQLCGFVEQHTELLRIIIRCNSDRDFVALFNELYAEIWSEFSGVDILKNLNQEDIKLLSLYSTGGCYFLLQHWLLGNIHMSAKEMADYLYGLLNKTDWLALGSQLGLLPGGKL